MLNLEFLTNVPQGPKIPVLSRSAWLCGQQNRERILKQIKGVSAPDV
jgi:hypothetical protein